MNELKIILVIGSSGLIGSNLINFLIKRNFYVICADLKNQILIIKKII